jgi:hypothetical protein
MPEPPVAYRTKEAFICGACVLIVFILLLACALS